MTLKISSEIAHKKINDFIDQVNELLKMNYREGGSKKSELDSEIQGFLTSAFKNGDDKGYSSSPPFFAAVVGHIPSEGEKQNDYISSLNRMRRHLIRFRSEVETLTGTEIVTEDNIFDTLEFIFSRFHRAVRQLNPPKRYGGRTPFKITDEYDVQDLLHAILQTHFSDIRPEEYTPSYAGNHRRMDFLLKPEKTVIEAKITRQNHKNNEISRELHDDIATYKNHPDCETLVCFVFDPEGWITNHEGFETDLESQSSDELKVKVYVYPK